MKIIGAGLAGLLAAHAWPQAPVLEAQPEPRANHRALLRFRTDEVSKLTGIPFRPVTVRKGIWHDSAFVPPNIKLANFYSHKVTGQLLNDRSIWSLEPVQRFIAPETFYDDLLDAVGARIQWATPYQFPAEPSPVVSTAPLHATLKALGIEVDGNPFVRAGINVARYRVLSGGADVYQTVYFPAPWENVYRASITGSMLIVESMVGDQFDETPLHEVLLPFGLTHSEVARLETSTQSHGKIVPLAPAMRKSILHQLTAKHKVFSLGRFATWRNILLDDVVQDIDVLRRLLRASEYETFLHHS